MRILKRGTRGDDVREWQEFLQRLARDRTVGLNVPVFQANGIFGQETQRATIAFQQRFGLRSDGVVGRGTVEKAYSVGFKESAKPAVAGGPTVKTPLPLPPAVEPLIPGPPPPPPRAGTTRSQSWARLRSESWASATYVQQGLTGGQATLQLLSNGAGDYVYDEYAVGVAEMPKEKTPEQFLKDMATDLNGTVKNERFSLINEFIRRRSGAPQLGELIDIDILGPDNGSVILVEMTATYFVFQTVDSDQMGAHPENGAREFVFERSEVGLRFYTRGVSRPGNIGVRYAGALPQQEGWTSLMRGISDRINALGGKSSFSSFWMYKEQRPN
jgi:peptidoglycan hydrolase-like protein with peptidoglycan-binding domain